MQYCSRCFVMYMYRLLGFSVNTVVAHQLIIWQVRTTQPDFTRSVFLFTPHSSI